MLQIKKELLVYNDHIKERLEFTCKYSNKDATFYNGNVISIKGTNLHYVEPHRFMINNHLFLFFNYSKEVYYKTLENKIELKYLYRIYQILSNMLLIKIKLKSNIMLQELIVMKIIFIKI